MSVGFIHGVMNTDNMAVSGETIDFGPCAFIESYDPAAVFSSIDGFGRYALANQWRAAHWNIARFAEALLPIIDPDPKRAVELAREELDAFRGTYEREWLVTMRGKLGFTLTQDRDLELVGDLLDLMHSSQADFTLTFRRLCDAVDLAQNAGPRDLFSDPAAYDRWAIDWRKRLAQEARSTGEIARAMRQRNPAFIPRNHRVEQALEAAIERDDFEPFLALLEVLSRPYDDQSARMEYALPAQPHERVVQTFCGT
jgi:uncharacterized protein YdiU (UPF0061 family)